MEERATRETRRETLNEQEAVLVPDTVQLPEPTIRKPDVSATLLAARSTAVAFRASSVAIEDRVGPLTTAQTVFAPAVVEIEPLMAVPLLSRNTPWLDESIEPSALKVVMVNTDFEAFFTPLGWP